MEFSAWGHAGTVDIEVTPNDDPTSLGCDLLVPGLGPEFWAGFPVCTATIEHEGQGYGSLFGWIQLVRSTDDQSGGTTFEIDPIAIYSDVATPFCWFGLTPILFDAPFRFRESSVDWSAHSFLCIVPTSVVHREVHAVLGFSWGFSVDDGAVLIRSPQPLVPAAWDAHLPHLRSLFGAWAFAEGFSLP